MRSCVCYFLGVPRPRAGVHVKVAQINARFGPERRLSALCFNALVMRPFPRARDAAAFACV